jgi:hypothetical protein
MLQTELDPQSLLTVSMWWTDARRHAAQHFWTSSQDATSVYLVTRVYKTRRFAMAGGVPPNTHTAITVSGFLNQSGKPTITEQKEWQAFEDEYGLAICQSNEPKTFQVGMLGYKLFRLGADQRLALRQMSEAVWR